MYFHFFGNGNLKGSKITKNSMKLTILGDFLLQNLLRYRSYGSDSLSFHITCISEPTNSPAQKSTSPPKHKSPPNALLPTSDNIKLEQGRLQPGIGLDSTCYNSRLFQSIVKGASDFKCKHCGMSFTKLESLTKHMYSKA